MISVGMDVHVRNSYLHVLGGDGKLLRSGRCRNTLGDLAGFLGRFEKEPMQVSLENTTNSRAIHRMLMTYRHEAGVELDARVLDARKLRIIAESVSKCDRLDAAVIAELTRADLALPTCYLPDDEEFALREHLRARHDLVTLRTRIKNRLHAVLHRRGILTPVKGSLFAGSGRAFWEQIELDEAGRAIVNRYLELLDRLCEAVGASTKDLRDLTRQPRWAKPAALLQTMPGIGLITSMTILAELGRIDRFKSRSAVANYVGLVPVLRSSNERCHSGGITKRGSKHLRAVLIEAAWEGSRRVPRYQDMFARISGRRGKKVAVVAVARRMVEDAWVMLTRDEAFRFSQSVAG